MVGVAPGGRQSAASDHGHCRTARPRLPVSAGRRRCSKRCPARRNLAGTGTIGAIGLGITIRPGSGTSSCRSSTWRAIRICRSKRSSNIWPITPTSTRVYPVSRSLQRFNDVGMLNHVTSANSATPYRDELFGPDFASSVFISEPVHNVVHREVLEPDGVTFTSHRAAGRAGPRVPGLHRQLVPADHAQDRAGRRALHRRHVPAGPRTSGMDSGRYSKAASTCAPGQDKGRIYRSFLRTPAPCGRSRAGRIDPAEQLVDRIAAPMAGRATRRSGCWLHACDRVGRAQTRSPGRCRAPVQNARAGALHSGRPGQAHRRCLSTLSATRIRPCANMPFG